MLLVCCLQVENAGGASSGDGKPQSALDVVVNIHDQRTQVCYGSVGEVARFEQFMYGESASATTRPLGAEEGWPLWCSWGVMADLVYRCWESGFYPFLLSLCLLTLCCPISTCACLLFVCLSLQAKYAPTLQARCSSSRYYNSVYTGIANGAAVFFRAHHPFFLNNCTMKIPLVWNSIY